jgi:hypothetical protein
MVAGAVLLENAGSAVLSSPPAALATMSVVLAVPGIFLILGLYTTIVGTLVAFAETLGLLTAHAEDRAHPGRNVWCCPRNVRAGFMVDRCSSVWVETHRTFPSQELAIIPERDEPLPPSKADFPSKEAPTCLHNGCDSPRCRVSPNQNTAQNVIHAELALITEDIMGYVMTS